MLGLLLSFDFRLNYAMIHVKMGFSFYCGPGYLAAIILAARIFEFEFVEVENSGNWDPFSFVLFFVFGAMQEYGKAEMRFFFKK